MKLVIKNAIGLIIIAVFIVLCFGFKSVPGRYPDAWIPMFIDTSDEVSTLINTDQITRITPKFHPELLLGHEPENSTYLEVQMANGEKIEVFEPFDEFVERIRRSQ
jgi:hypothetical protein